MGNRESLEIYIFAYVIQRQFISPYRFHKTSVPNLAVSAMPLSTAGTTIHGTNVPTSKDINNIYFYICVNIYSLKIPTL